MAPEYKVFMEMAVAVMGRAAEYVTKMILKRNGWQRIDTTTREQTRTERQTKARRENS